MAFAFEGVAAFLSRVRSVYLGREPCIPFALHAFLGSCSHLEAASVGEGFQGIRFIYVLCIGALNYFTDRVITYCMVYVSGTV